MGRWFSNSRELFKLYTYRKESTMFGLLPVCVEIAAVTAAAIVGKELLDD